MHAEQGSQDRRMDDARLQRIETKLDALTDAMTKLVAVEAHQHHFQERLNRLETRVDGMDGRIRNLSTTEAATSSGSQMFERIALIFFSSAIAVAATLAIESGMS